MSPVTIFTRLSRRTLLKSAFTLGAALAAPVLFGPLVPRPGRDDFETLLPVYLYSTRANVVLMNGRRAMLSSRLYPQGTYIRDAFYGPWALGDLALSQEAYEWFVESQFPDGQVRTVVPFDPATPGMDTHDDDSALLFILWSAVLGRQGGTPAMDAVTRAWAWASARVQDGYYVSPAGAFRYWADTVMPDVPERIAHNQGLYVAALLALQALDVPCGGAHALAVAANRYNRFFDPGAGYVTLGMDSRFARCQDVSATFGEFLCRYVFDRPVLADDAISASLQRLLDTAAAYFPSGTPAGVKVISAPDGSFLPPGQFYVPVLNKPGDYQNGGYWPMYTLVALALDYTLRPDPVRRQLIADLVTLELARDQISKEVMLLVPGKLGEFDPNRSGYTWNALIPRALHWAGIAGPVSG